MKNDNIRPKPMQTRASEYLSKINPDLQSYFIGKLCTIICTNSAAMHFAIKTTNDYYNHFLGTIEAFDNEGILVKHVGGKTKQYFYKNNIIGIVEETVKNIDKETIKKNIEKAKPEKIEPITLESLMSQCASKE